MQQGRDAHRKTSKQVAYEKTDDVTNGAGSETRCREQDVKEMTKVYQKHLDEYVARTVASPCEVSLKDQPMTDTDGPLPPKKTGREFL